MREKRECQRLFPFPIRARETAKRGVTPAEKGPTPFWDPFLQGTGLVGEGFEDGFGLLELGHAGEVVGDGHDVVEDFGEVLRAFNDGPGHLAGGVLVERHALVSEDLGKAADVVERSMELVAHVVDEDRLHV